MEENKEKDIKIQEKEKGSYTDGFFDNVYNKVNKNKEESNNIYDEDIKKIAGYINKSGKTLILTEIGIYSLIAYFLYIYFSI